MMRTLLFGLVAVLLALPARAQSSGDTVIVKNGGAAKNEPDYFGDDKFTVSKWDTLEVTGREDKYIQVRKEGQRGWVERRSIFTEEELREARQEREAARRRERERQKYLKELRSNGYTVILAGQTFDRDSAGGIDVGLSLVNISESKTVKYATATWELYNPVGDPVGKGLNSPTAQTRFVGPLEPGKAGQSTFDNVWRSDVGSCAELKKLVVEHIDGSSFTYVNDLREIAKLSETVRLDGDCSYEAQQKREN